MLQVHASCVEIEGVGALLRGGPGAGKSDLALRLVDEGARLVADDRVNLVVADGRLKASAPPEIAGLIEVRGIGVVRLGAVGEAAVGLVVDLVAPGAVERVPDPARCDVLGVALPLFAVDPALPSAAAAVRLAARLAAGAIMRLP